MSARAESGETCVDRTLSIVVLNPVEQHEYEGAERVFKNTVFGAK